ncbi:MAG TPA: hypothetical protein VLM40_06130 [Gemmata sp.]|nr:hypothetical protein [Gemmata sp.]
MPRLCVLGLVGLALTGCGTVHNFIDFPEDTGERTTPYGGVKIAVNGIKESYDVELPYTWPFRLADVVLSAVGDTLTLPVTLPIAGLHAIYDSIRDHYFPDQKPKVDNPRESPSVSQSSHISSERMP